MKRGATSSITQTQAPPDMKAEVRGGRRREFQRECGTGGGEAEGGGGGQCLRHGGGSGARGGSAPHQLHHQHPQGTPWIGAASRRDARESLGVGAGMGSGVGSPASPLGMSPAFGREGFGDFSPAPTAMPGDMMGGMGGMGGRDYSPRSSVSPRILSASAFSARGGGLPLSMSALPGGGPVGGPMAVLWVVLWAVLWALCRATRSTRPQHGGRRRRSQHVVTGPSEVERGLDRPTDDEYSCTPKMAITGTHGPSADTFYK